MDLQNISSWPWANTDTWISESREADRFRLIPTTNYLHALPGEHPDDFAERDKLAVEWCDFVLNALTRLYVYGKGPTRTLEFSTENDAVRAYWQRYLGEIPPLDHEDEACDYNVVMRQIHEETLYHGVVLVKAHWRDGNTVLPVVFRPWQFNVVLDPLDRRKFNAVKVLVNASTSEIALGQEEKSSQIWEVWTREAFTYADGDGKLLPWVDASGAQVTGWRDNPYGMLPFLRHARDQVHYDFWCVGLCESLVNTCKVLAGLDTEQVDLMYWLFGQPVIKGDPSGREDLKSKEYFFGKGAPVVLKDGGDFNRVGAAVQMTDFLASYKSLLTRWALSIGLSPAAFDEKVYEARDPSGVAIREAQTGPLDSRDSDVKTYIRLEQRMAALVALVEATHQGDDVSVWLPTRYDVHFPDAATTSETAQDRREKWRLQIEGVLKPRYQIAQEIDPGLTQDAAIAQVAEAQAEKPPPW